MWYPGQEPYPAAGHVQEIALLAGVLHRPVGALLLASVGGVLILVEFHRPGRVLPGAIGLGLLLLGAHSLSLQPVHAWAVTLAACALVLLILPWMLPRRTELGPMGTAALCVALAFLPRYPGVGWVRMATVAGVLLGALCSALTTIAGRARRAKRQLHPHPVAAERWE